MNTRELIEAWPLFTDQERADLLLAVSTRGKNEGYLLANAPGSVAGTKYVAWQVLVSNLAPARVSVWGLLSGNNNAGKFKQLDSKVDTRLFRICLNAVEPPQRWNLWAWNNDRDVVLENIPKVINALAFRIAAKEAGQKELF